jgi:hypothetical protein
MKTNYSSSHSPTGATGEMEMSADREERNRMEIWRERVDIVRSLGKFLLTHAFVHTQKLLRKSCNVLVEEQWTEKEHVSPSCFTINSASEA